jgi:hypothetical protein
MNILIILLGCHVQSLLNDRINSAVNAMNEISNYETSIYEFENEILYSRCSVNEPNITWFLSGGVKYKEQNVFQKSEAEIMMELIQSHNTHENLNWSFKLDIEATNTAENFIMANRYIKQQIQEKHITYDDIYTVTNEFHYNRAKFIADLINSYNDYNWILGSAELFDSKRWERIHIKNVKNDVMNALNKYSYE